MSESGLPSGWRRLHLGDVVREYLSGGTPSTRESAYWDGDIAWTTSAVIADEAVTLSTGQRLITDLGLKQSATHLVPRGNLLVGTRVGVGKAVVNLIDIAISQDLTGLVIEPSTVDALYLAYAFKTAYTRVFFEGRKRGTTIKGVSRSDVRALPLVLPPLAEQRAIANILRAVQAAREARQREVSLERERKAALMAHLFTYGTRGEPTKQTPIGEMPESWEVARLEKCAYIQTGITKGRRFKDDEPTIEVPYLRVANVQDGYLDLSEIRNIEIRASEHGRYRLQAGDVLMTEGGDADKLGRGFIWSNEVPGCVHQNHVFAVRVNKDRLTPEFLSYQTQSPYGKAYFLNVGHRTTNLASINSTKLGAYPALLAPLDEQDRIVNLLRACDVKVAALERESTLLDELFRALLEELMTGRLSVAPIIDHTPY